MLPGPVCRIPWPREPRSAIVSGTPVFDTAISPLVEFVTCSEPTAVFRGLESEPTPVAALIARVAAVIVPFEVLTIPPELKVTALALEMPDSEPAVPTRTAPELTKLKP